MDAKPQRPRVLRIYDENMLPPALPQGKTLHQRTKSVPAFSTMHTGAKALAAAAATAATKKILGNINTNTRVMQPAKDDSVLGKKLVDTDNLKASGFPLTRPAVRPSAKSFSTVSSTNPTAVKEAVAVQPVVPIQEPVRAVVAKKSTKVLKDAEITTVKSVEQPDTILEAHANELSLEAAPVSAPVQIESTIPSQDVPSQHNIVDPTTVVVATTTSHSASPSVIPSEKDYVVHLEAQAEQFEAHFSNQGVSVIPYTVAAPMPTQHYYDDETLEYCDDDGYTTGRSLTLRASIGGTTTVLVPKPTEKATAEIKAAKLLVESTRTDEEIDDEEWDTSMVAEYSEEIFTYMRKLEHRMLPNPRYMEHQQEIQWSMRAVLIDWVVQVHQRFNLLPETLFLAVNYIDRFLTVKVVSLGKLQLVGATALFIASKFEEVNCPTIQEIIFMVDGGYSMDELLKAERFMLSMLQFDLGWPGPMSFLRRISKADDYDLESRTLAKYFLEVTLMDERFVGCTPSYLAAGAHCMARFMLRKGDWTTAHVAYSEYTYAQLRPLLQGMVDCCSNPQKHHLSVYEKYTDKRYKRASAFVEGEMMRGFNLHPRHIHNSLTQFCLPREQC